MFQVEQADSGYIRVQHPNGDIEHGMTNIVFPGPEQWGDITDMYTLCCNEIGLGADKRFVWHNDDFLLVTAANPLTGEYPRGEARPGETKAVGYEGGVREFTPLLAEIKERCTACDGLLYKRRGYI